MIFRRRAPASPNAEALACDMVRKSDLFDASWYLDQYPDVARAEFDPALHYVRHGAKEGRNPGPWFNTVSYLEQLDKDIGDKNPLLHYVENRGREDIRAFLKKGRAYSNLASFLRVAALSPIVSAPFMEEDYRCFAVMESLAKYLVQSLHGDETLKVSIIMPVRNRENTLRAAIASVLAQKYKNFELIIVDDASEDNSVFLAEQACSIDTRVRAIRSVEHVGVCAARNLGLAQASGEIIAYLDSDNTWLDDHLGATVGALNLLPTADSIYVGQYLYADVNVEKLTAIRFAPFNRSLFEQHNYIDLNCVVHRRNVIDEGIRFDENLGRLVDWDFIMQISNCFRIVSVPIITSKYYLHAAENTITKTVPMEAALEQVIWRSREKDFSLASLSLQQKICIVIPSYEALQFLQKCIASLCPYLNSHLVEAVIVDNASSEEVRSYLKSINEKNIRVVFNDINYGFSYAVNQAIKFASADADIVLLNNDAELGAFSLEMLQKTVYESSDIAISVPRQIVPGSTADMNKHVPYANLRQACDVSLSAHHGNIESIDLFHDGQQFDLNFAPFFCVYIRRSVWDASGGLDYENGRHYRSDRIMCDFVKQVLRLRIVYTPGALVYHGAQASTKLLDNTLDSNSVANYRMMLIKNAWPEELRKRLGIENRPWSED